MNPKTPYFSVVIPTRNRPKWLEQCLDAVLTQTFSDYEVIIVDNDSAEELETIKVFSTKKGDPKLRYVRTGGLGMAENWQVAVESALGEYIIVCSDKLQIQPWLLRTIYDSLKTEEIDAIVWQLGNYSQVSAAEPKIICREIVFGNEIMEAAMSCSWRLLWSAGPRGMNCAFRRSYISRVKEELGVPICRPICPDYNIALSLAALNSKNLILNIVGSVFLPNADGNGMLCLLTPDQEVIKKSFGSYDLSYLPVKYLTAVTSIAQDILATSKLVPQASFGNFNWENLFILLIHEIVDIEIMGGDTESRKKELLCALDCKPIRFRIALLKTIGGQEIRNLISRRRSFKCQLRRMAGLSKFFKPLITNIIPFRNASQLQLF
jgi:glycosyltransferase involved in cell wall biosynthesis